MKKGGKRLPVPPSLGYTPVEAGNDIPSGAILPHARDHNDTR
jgi:hypothetical protein